MSNGYLHQHRQRPVALTIVIAAHVAAVTALALAKQDFIPITYFPDTKVRFVEDPPVPPIQPPEKVEREVQQPDRFTTQQPIVDLRQQEPVIVRDPPVTDPVTIDPLPPAREPATRPADPPPPVRIEARIDPRSELQPPYPPAEQRMSEEGSVTVRVRIGADGRVLSIERLRATSDGFWRVTERHALRRWRFKPATEDGRPVESVREMTVHFRMTD